MSVYDARREALKERLALDLHTYLENPSALNYSMLENGMLVYQHHIKNIDPDKYNAYWNEVHNKMLRKAELYKGR